MTPGTSLEGRSSWSNDGKWIYHRSNRTGAAQIWKIPAAGGEGVQVTKEGGYEAFEAPDGKLLYYTKGGSTVAGLWSMPVAGGPETRVLASPRTGYWGVNDKGSYYVDFGDSAGGNPPLPVRFFDFASGQTSQVGVIEKPVNRGMPGFSVTRDGRWIIWGQIDRQDTDLMLVENFR